MSDSGQTETHAHQLGLEEQRPTTKRVKSPSSTPRARLQVGLFGALIALGTLIMASPLPVEWHFGSAIGLTAFYCVVGTVLNWHRKAGVGEHFIDSCYYLGFVFTQIALAVSFWKAFQSGGQFSANDLVPLVATALGASVVGLIAKVVLDQAVDDDAALPEQVQQDVAKSAAAIAADTRSVADTFKGLADHLRDVAENSRAAFAGASSVNELTQSHQRSLSDTLQQLTQQVNDLRSQMASSSESAQAGIRGMVGDLQATVQVMGDLRRLTAQIGDIGDTAQRVLQESSGAFASANDVGRRFEQQMTATTESIREDFAGIADRVESNANRIVQESVSGAQAQLGQSLQVLTAELRRSENAIADLVQSFDANLRALTDGGGARRSD